MPLPATVPRRRALTASAARMGSSGGNSADNTYVQRTALNWQQQAMALRPIVPELNYACNFYARMLSKVRFFPGTQKPDGSIEPITEGAPVELLNRIQDVGGGRSRILYRYGQLMFTTGEGFLLGKKLDEGPGDWSFVWRDEIRFDDDGKTVTHLLAPGAKPVTLKTIPISDYEPVSPGTVVAYRMWTPDLRFSGWPDAPMRGVLEVAEELLILTKAVHATATSRLVRGLLLMPSEIMPPPLETNGDEDPENDPFLTEYAEHIEAVIEDPSAAGAMAPYTLWGAYEYLDKVRHVALHDPQTDYLEKDLRKEAIQRAAYGLDMPPEALTGFGSTNHWAAFQIQDSVWQDHGDPKARQFAHDVNEVYLRPALEKEGYAGWRDVVIGYDATAVVINPDRSDDANEAYDRFAVGPTGLRKMKNIPEGYAPTPEELDLMIETKIVRERISENKAVQSPATPGDGPPPSGGDSVKIVEPKLASANGHGRELGAAEMAILNCRRVAGIRLRSNTYAKRYPALIPLAEGQPSELVASAIGQEKIVQHEIDARELVRDGTDAFRTWLHALGYKTSETDVLCDMLERYAASTLCQRELPDVPAGFVAHLERLREVLV